MCASMHDLAQKSLELARLRFLNSFRKCFVNIIYTTIYAKQNRLANEAHTAVTMTTKQQPLFALKGENTRFLKSRLAKGKSSIRVWEDLPSFCIVSSEFYYAAAVEIKIIKESSPRFSTSVYNRK